MSHHRTNRSGQTLVTRSTRPPPVLPRRPTRTLPRTAMSTPLPVPPLPRMPLAVCYPLLSTRYQVADNSPRQDRRVQELCQRRGQQAGCYSLSGSIIRPPSTRLQLHDPKFVSISTGRWSRHELFAVLQHSDTNP